MEALWVAIGCAIAAILYGAWQASRILALPAGNERMQEISAAVRTFARTETFIPMIPQSPESTAPIRKPNAVVQPSCGTKPIARNRNSPT